MNRASANPSSATNTSVVATPGAGKKIVVYGVYVSSDTQQVITFTSGAGGTALHKQYVAADGGQVPVFTPKRIPLFECAANSTLHVTTSASGNAWVTAWYDILNA